MEKCRCRSFFVLTFCTLVGWLMNFVRLTLQASYFSWFGGKGTVFRLTSEVFSKLKPRPGTGDEINQQSTRQLRKFTSCRIMLTLHLFRLILQKYHLRFRYNVSNNTAFVRWKNSKKRRTNKFTSYKTLMLANLAKVDEWRVKKSVLILRSFRTFPNT